ncbi:transcriptional regulator [Flavobacterium sp.]|jgi:plasmid maintenance system antidote protein VapI|uniref:transcriptional regulator n=1 Tax=Flavobacterium sp. TaxID=239 RepID=UPI0037BE2EF6
MNTYLEKYKGIHPGFILEREFKKRALHKRPFALSIGEHPQTLNAITKGKRKLNTALALKIEERLGLEEGTLAILQTYFDINEEKQKREDNTPNLALIRKALFWDTDITMIDWDKQYKAVIRRIFERGNETEKQELIHFYGEEKINIALNTSSGKPYTIYKNK